MNWNGMAGWCSTTQYQNVLTKTRVYTVSPRSAVKRTRQIKPYY